MLFWLSRSTMMDASMTTSLLVGALLPVVDHHGGRVGQLLAQRQEQLLANQLGGQEPLGAIGQHVGGRTAAGPAGRSLHSSLTSPATPEPLRGRHRHQRGEACAISCQA